MPKEFTQFDFDKYYKKGNFEKLFPLHYTEFERGEIQIHRCPRPVQPVVTSIILFIVYSHLNCSEIKAYTKVELSYM